MNITVVERLTTFQKLADDLRPELYEANLCSIFDDSHRCDRQRGRFLVWRVQTERARARPGCRSHRQYRDILEAVPDSIASTSPTTALSTAADNACNSSLNAGNTFTTFKDLTYGFTLSLDHLWKGYKVVSMPSYQGTDSTLLQFEIPTGSLNGTETYGVALTMAVWPISDWRKMLPFGGPADYISVPTFIGSNTKYLFGYFLVQDPGFIPNYTCEVGRIMETFEPLPNWN